MLRVAWVAVYAAIGLTILFLFLGAVAFQSGDSISVGHQQSVLNSFGSVLRSDLYGVEDRDSFLKDHKVLESPEVAAFVLNAGNEISGQSWVGEPPFGMREVIARITAEPDLKSYQQVLDINDARLVWHVTPLSDGGDRLVLVHQCVNVGVGELTELYILPIAIASILVFWAAFWAAMTARRMIRSQARQQQLEVELLRHEEADKIRAAFLANMSHELRTPLNAIIGFSEMLKMRAFGSLGHEKNGEYVDGIHDAGSSLLKLVTNLLDLSRIESGGEDLEEEQIVLADALESVRLMVGPSCAEKGIEFRIQPDGNLPDLWGDPVKVREAMLHLCRNALTHTPKGGLIELRARCGKNRAITLEIGDTGRGIDGKQLATIVDNFGHAYSQAETAKSGAGVGLPLTNALMLLHDGRLKLLSTVGEGTIAQLCFPPERSCEPSPRPEMARAS
ncbi:sensor histidine kinase [Minwuia sp.]|uniref:sensor histidine kinase n=1 Tax=Minwuia sp. TaxID=2493630 RepID=UPI003A9328CB